jgi:DnaK suppressor protein
LGFLGFLGGPRDTAGAACPDHDERFNRRVTVGRTNLTATDRRTYRRRLRDLTARLSGGALQLETEARWCPAHEADRAVRELEEGLARTLLASEEQILGEATAALERFAAGTFGACERCGRAIAKARLDALPYARECTRCARETAAGDAT